MIIQPTIRKNVISTTEYLEIPIPPGEWVLEHYDLGIGAESGGCARAEIQLRRGEGDTTLDSGMIVTGTMQNGLRGNPHIHVQMGELIRGKVQFAPAGNLIEMELRLRKVR